MFNTRIGTMFFLIVAALSAWFLYLQRDILAPFIVALIFAYIFNPLINFFSKNLRVPRVLSIILVYLILIGSVVFLANLLTREVIKESFNIRNSLVSYVQTLRGTVLPDPIGPLLQTQIESFSKNQLPNIGVLAFPIFTIAFSSILNILVFLFATFFFLKDNRTIIEKLLQVVPKENRQEAAALLAQINIALSKYLRGQILLVIALAIMLFAGFSILGVKNALTISILSALAGIVPMIGAIVSISVGTFIIVISGGIHNFSVSLPITIALVVGVYYGCQLIQDYVLTPFVIGKAVRLHPLMILFAALAGGNMAGILGLVLAVPVAAIVKILYDYWLDKVNNRDFEKRKDF